MKKILLATMIALCILCANCSLRLHEPQVEIPNEYLYANPYYCCDESVNDKWWQCFDDATLDSLIDHAVRHNHDLAAAVANVEASRHLLRVARAEFLPALDFDATTEIVHELKNTEKEYTIAPEIAWEISLFGALRNTKRSARASLYAQEWTLRGVWLSLTAEVATTYFTLLEYQRSLYIARRSYDLRRTETALIDSMYRYGMKGNTDLMQAKSLVYSAKIEIEKYQRAVTLTTLSMATLLGENPTNVNWEDYGRALIDDALPLQVPIGIPSSLLERRPDVMKSYYDMQQAAAEVGISRAERYPTITLSGSGGIYSTSLTGLTSGDPLLWSATGELIAPLFSWGSRRAKEMMSREKYRAAVCEYEQSVIEAISDVEQTLVSIDTYSNEGAASAALVMANTKIAENTNALYRGGLGDYLSVIDAQRELYASQISLIEIVAQQYINYVELFKALGGGL